MEKYLKMLNQILKPAPNIVVNMPSIKNKKYLLMFSLPKMRVKQFRWAQLESTPLTLLSTLSPPWGRFSNLEIIGLGKKIKSYRRIFITEMKLKHLKYLPSKS